MKEKLKKEREKSEALKRASVDYERRRGSSGGGGGGGGGGLKRLL